MLPPDLLRRVIETKAKIDGTRPEDYGLPQGERLNEVITQSWNRLRKHWAEFSAAAAGLPPGDSGTGLTNDRWSLPLLRELGFGQLPTSAGPKLGETTYAINRFLGPVPIHLVGCGLSLDRRAGGARGAARVNPHGLVQELLNRSESHLWAIVSNGLRLRVLRDNVALSRQSYLEFDIEAMFAGEVFSDFVVLWLLVHASRFTPREGKGPEFCWLEQWTKLAEEQGTRALGELRGGVERALQILGEGFTSHPKNADLREALQTGQLPLADFHGQLLRVVYRLIFLFVAEDRTLEGQPLLHPPDDSDAGRMARERYSAYYSTARLREMAGKIKGSRHGDLWQQFQLLVGALSGNEYSAATRKSLALPALGSFLWNPKFTIVLNDAHLANYDLLEALRRLAFTRQGRMLRPVDYRNLGAEELGGVYEGLLALTPQISSDGARFSFVELAGNERKTSGSYYTPDSLVQTLLDSALDPVVEVAIDGKVGVDAEMAILALRVCDPAVGSGHFLVGSAHRLARHLARVRSLGDGESEPSPLLYQHALRDVIGRCLYGVDINPMAAELCRVSLWLEALEPGRPLSFLDHHIRVGNSLLGATSQHIARGLPDDAFISNEGDDKTFCSELKRRNRRERDGQANMLHLMEADRVDEFGALADRGRSIDATPDDTLGDVRHKAEQFSRLIVSAEYKHAQLVGDAYCAAFVCRKRPNGTSEPITTDTIRRLEADATTLSSAQQAEVDRLSSHFQFFHWHLAFPEVVANGGFDCMIGNPPWIRQEMLRPIKRLLPLFECFTGTADSSAYFLELSVLLCRPHGRVAMLTPNKWFRASYAVNLRKFLRQRCRVHLLIDFGHSRNLFSDADTFPAAVILEPASSRVSDSEISRFVQAHDSDRESQLLPDLIRTRVVEVAHSNLTEDRWHLENSDVSSLLSRLITTGRPLESVLQRPLLRGLLTGFNDAFYVETPLRNAILAANPSSEPLFKKLLRGRDVKRWAPSWSEQWHIVIPSSQNRTWPWSNATDANEAEAIFAATHPSVHAYLKQFERPLRARQDQGKYWWELRACDYYGDFEKPKVIVQCIAYYSQFAFDDGAHYINNKVILIPTEDLYLLGILNSRVTWWIINRTFQHMKDEGLSVDVQFLKRLPVPIVSDALRADISRLARELVGAGHVKGEHTGARSELLLNELVEHAFALSDTERQVLLSSLPPRDPVEVLVAN